MHVNLFTNLAAVACVILSVVDAGSTSTSTRTQTQTPSRIGPITANAYSGSSTTRDPCCRLLEYMYPFGLSFGDTEATPKCDGR